MKKIIKIVLIISIFLPLLIYFTGFGKTSLSILKYYAPFNLGNNIKEKINIFNNISKLKSEKIKTEKNLGNIPKLIGYLPIRLTGSKKYIDINNKRFNFKKFEISLLLISKNKVFNTKGNSYIDNFGKKLFVVSGNGIFSYIDLDEFNKDESKLIFLPTNIKEIIKNNDFYINSRIGIKDILISENNIYVSYVKEVIKNCFNIAIIKAKINKDYLKFEEFFNPPQNDRVCKDYIDFNAHSTGGRIVKYKNNNLLLSTGEFLDSLKAQNSESTLGKILEIQNSGKKFKLVSKGHRNVQGLFFDQVNNTIYSTEHGPFGGDEININNLDKNEVKNYGWPIASYGEHYGGKSMLNKLTRYIKYPLKKSHKNNGFIEPLKFYIPSVGISNILILDNEFLNSDNQQILSTSLKGKSLNYIQIKNNEIILDETIQLGERIRDIIYIKDINKIILTLENEDENSKIAIISN